MSGLRTHDRFFPGHGVPAVLVHGLAVSHRYLMPTARALAAAGHPVMVPDLPGFGWSDKPRAVTADPAAAPGRRRFRGRRAAASDGRQVAWDVEQHAGHLAAWLDTLGVPRVCLVGHSFGAEVAARLAVRRPDLVSALVLAGPTVDPLSRSRTALVRRWLVDLLIEAPAQAPVIAFDVAQARPWRVLATVDHSVRNAVEDDLTELPIRPLILGGELDPIAPLHWRASVAALTGGTAVTISRAAHNVMTTSGRRCAGLISAHIAQADG